MIVNYLHNLSPLNSLRVSASLGPLGTMQSFEC